MFSKLFLARSVSLAIDFSAYEDSNTCEIEPKHQDDQRSKRAISNAIGVEIVEVNTETERNEEPQRNPNKSARCEKPSLAATNVWCEVVDDIKGCQNKNEGDRPLQYLPGSGEHIAKPKSTR